MIFYKHYYKNCYKNKINNQWLATMNKRTFLKSLFSLPMPFFLGRSNTVIAAPKVKTVLLNDCSVAGFQYYQGEEILATIEKNAHLTLLAEPSNPYDKYAIEIYYQNKKLGYIPRKENRHVSEILQANIKTYAKVTWVNRSDTAWHSLGLQVYMDV